MTMSCVHNLTFFTIIIIAAIFSIAKKISSDNIPCKNANENSKDYAINFEHDNSKEAIFIILILTCLKYKYTSIYRIFSMEQAYIHTSMILNFDDHFNPVSSTLLICVM
ncbi:hypothetical protein PV328_003788 [Microctonus aethiopoides]|uniref:Uncharacterized protein n=1 Tax=Microctonus aethiopoides TaxID=144406 RepID=A0AA39F9D0_9HYME|nr:hypothetical protein PV328_003788 [Microctonus aethiopoides]